MTDQEQTITPADATIVSSGLGTKGPEERTLPATLQEDMDLCLNILRQVLSEYDENLLKTFDTVRQYAVDASAERFSGVLTDTHPERDDLEMAVKTIDAMNLHDAQLLARAFATYFHLANLCEENYRVAVLHEREAKVDDTQAIDPVNEMTKAYHQLISEMGPAKAKELLAQEQPVVTRLVCAAGFGKMGNIAAVDPGDNLAMIDLNCWAAVGVTGLCLPYLTRGSRVLEICSTAAFQPMPGLGVYAATKAFLHSYAKTLHHELLPKGIHVTAVCPYWVKDTEFIPLAQEGKAGQFHHFPLASRSKSVVALSLAASAVNLWVATPGIVCTLHRVAAKFIPHCLMVPLMELFRRL